MTDEETSSCSSWDVYLGHRGVHHKRYLANRHSRSLTAHAALQRLSILKSANGVGEAERQGSPGASEGDGAAACSPGSGGGGNAAAVRPWAGGTEQLRITIAGADRNEGCTPAETAQRFSELLRLVAEEGVRSVRLLLCGPDVSPQSQAGTLHLQLPKAQSCSTVSGCPTAAAPVQAGHMRPCSLAATGACGTMCSSAAAGAASAAGGAAPAEAPVPFAAWAPQAMQACACTSSTLYPSDEERARAHATSGDKEFQRAAHAAADASRRTHRRHQRRARTPWRSHFLSQHSAPGASAGVSTAVPGPAAGAAAAPALEGAPGSAQGEPQGPGVVVLEGSSVQPGVNQGPSNVQATAPLKDGAHSIPHIALLLPDVTAGAAAGPGSNGAAGGGAGSAAQEAPAAEGLGVQGPGVLTVRVAYAHGRLHDLAARLGQAQQQQQQTQQRQAKEQQRGGLGVGAEQADYDTPLNPPHLVACFNAQVWGYGRAWTDSLAYAVRELRAPVLVTSLSADEAEEDFDTIEEAGAGIAMVWEPETNPWRSLRPSPAPPESDAGSDAGSDQQGCGEEGGSTAEIDERGEEHGGGSGAGSICSGSAGRDAPDRASNHSWLMLAPAR